MQAFNKLAGVQEASDTTQPSHPTLAPESYPPLPPIPQDEDRSFDARSSRRGSQHSVGLPSRTHRSNLSLHSRRSIARSRPGSTKGSRALKGTHSRDNSDDADTAQQQQQPRASHDSEQQQYEEDDAYTEDEDDEFTWGPSHPCFPHPNPHCSPDSLAAHTTRVIRIRRDWLASGDLYPQYANLYPEILSPLISDYEFRFLLSNINAILARAFTPYSTRAWFDAIVGVLTGYAWEDCGFTGARIGEHELERFMRKWNMEREGQGREGRVMMLRRTGFLTLDFVVPDPGIDGLGDEEEVEEEEYTEES
ncbi:unnamed protein product [Zymoseptoria tritici ST99CH_1A5]|uniref:Ras modification protein ERF4 n=1 Tax=Zymoseptoria tritici ST99CH_1A5 TaxID=1276529 RepID=A0A1Y6LWF1_ZYMTR|nr:unnamed protein product [Zymoseptoria tritici ST99CH_1A5]